MPVDTKPYRTVEMPEAGTPEWLEIRRTTGIGASEIAAVLGQSPWATALNVYLQKRGLTADTESNRAMRQGNHSESFIQSEFEMEMGFKGIKPDWMAVSNQYPYLFCNLDWLSDCGTFGAELKRTDNTKDWGESGSQNVPLHYYLQVQHQLLVTGLDLIYLVALLPFSDLRIYPIVPSAGVQERIATDGGIFWSNTLDGIAPENDASVEAVKTLYPVVETGKEIEITDSEALDLVCKHEETVAAIKDLTEIKGQIEARLLMLAGDAQKAKIPGWNGSITRSVIEAKSYTVNRKAGITCRINHPRKSGE